jgi:hypothetical protein
VIRTNADDSIDFRIVEAPTETPGKALVDGPARRALH